MLQLPLRTCVMLRSFWTKVDFFQNLTRITADNGAGTWYLYHHTSTCTSWPKLLVCMGLHTMYDRIQCSRES